MTCKVKPGSWGMVSGGRGDNSPSFLKEGVRGWSGWDDGTRIRGTEDPRMQSALTGRNRDPTPFGLRAILRDLSTRNSMPDSTDRALSDDPPEPSLRVPVSVCIVAHDEELNIARA